MVKEFEENYTTRLNVSVLAFRIEKNRFLSSLHVNPYQDTSRTAFVRIHLLVWFSLDGNSPLRFIIFFSY